MADLTTLTPRTIETAVRSQFDNEIASNACQKHPVLGFIVMKYGNKKKGNKMGIGIPDDGILTGLKLSSPERKEIKSHTWEPAIHTGLPTNLTVKKTWYDNSANDSANANAAANGPLSRIKRPKFCRTDYATPIKVYKRDIAQIQAAFGRAMKSGNTAQADKLANDVTEICTNAAVENLINQMETINSELWAITSDYPTDESLKLWDKQHSFRSMCDTDNSYGGIDRAVAGNEMWQGNLYASKLPADIDYLFNFVQYNGADGSGMGLSNKGNRPNLWAVGNVLFPMFKAQAKARDLKIYSGDEIPDVPVFGQKQEAIQLNNGTFIINDPSCPTKGVNGATKNALLMLDTDKMVTSFFEDKSFKVTPFFDLSQIPGSAEALASEIQTEMGIWTRHPWAHVWLEDVG
jgi:hypothetical protein